MVGMPDTMPMPTLYKKASTGAIQEWTIFTEDATIVTRWGQMGGAIQEARDLVKEGKNIGKKNETTAEEQARLEAKSQWEKKLKKGYVQNPYDAESGKVDSIIEGGISPMLAQSYSKHAEKIKFPAYVQPKFDGHRCIATIDMDGNCHLWTRTRKPITGLPHIQRDIEAFAVRTGLIGPFDGELYNHSYKDRFEELSSFIRTPEPKDGYTVVQYHIYDIADNTVTQWGRLTLLDKLNVTKDSLVGVETIKVEDEDEMMAAFDRFLEQGYEGLMVRNALGMYVNKRSYDLQKVKEFDDAEFKIIGVEEGRGKLAGKAIFVCEFEGRPFKAKMKGKLDDLKKYIDDPSLAVGKQLTVQFQGWTNKNKVPRFPVGLRIRED